MSKELIISLLVPAVGLVLFLQAPHGRMMEVGRITFAMGLLALLLVWVRGR